MPTATPCFRLIDPATRITAAEVDVHIPEFTLHPDAPHKRWRMSPAEWDYLDGRRPVAVAPRNAEAADLFVEWIRDPSDRLRHYVVAGLGRSRLLQVETIPYGLSQFAGEKGLPPLEAYLVRMRTPPYEEARLQCVDLRKHLSAYLADVAVQLQMSDEHARALSSAVADLNSVLSKLTASAADFRPLVEHIERIRPAVDTIAGTLLSYPSLGGHVKFAASRLRMIFSEYKDVPKRYGERSFRVLDMLHFYFVVIRKRWFERQAKVDEQQLTLHEDRLLAATYFFDSLIGVYQTSRRLSYAKEAGAIRRDPHGSLLEAAVRQAVARWVAPLSVSTGMILGAPRKEQLDVIIWDRRVAGTYFEIGENVCVPPESICGILEVKGSEHDLASVALRLNKICASLIALERLSGGELEHPDVAKTGDGERIDQLHHPDAIPVKAVVISDRRSLARVRLESGGMVLSLFRWNGERPIPNFEAYDELHAFVTATVRRSFRNLRQI